MLPFAVQDMLLYILLLWPYVGIVMGAFYVFALAKFTLASLLTLAGVDKSKASSFEEKLA